MDGDSYWIGYCWWTIFDMGWGVLFMGIGGEFVLTLEGLTEKAISHWLRFQELARMTDGN